MKRDNGLLKKRKLLDTEISVAIEQIAYRLIKRKFLFADESRTNKKNSQGK